MITKRLEEKKKLENVKLQKVGNQQQYDHGLEVYENYEKVIRSIEKGEEIAKTKDILEDGKKVITKRLKMIRLADREDWMTVNEYLSDNLASDSADEKAISKAIKAAASAFL